MDLVAVNCASVVMVMVAMNTLIAIGSSLTTSDRQITDQERLYRDVVSSQPQTGSQCIRPVLDHTKAVTVQYGLVLYSIVDVDSRNQMMTTRLWPTITWTNEFSTWNPDDYGGITQVVVQSSAIWTPDIALINSATNYDIQTVKMVTIDANGTSNIIDAISASSSCKINVAMFPFDQQNCTLTFASWVYYDDELLPVFLDGQEAFDVTTSFVNSSQWDIVASGASSDLESDDVSSWHRLNFYVTVRRRPGFQIFVLVVPSLLLSILTPLLFCLPPTRPDRISLGIYYCFNMSLIALSTILSITVIHISNRHSITADKGSLSSGKISWILRILSKPIGLCNCKCYRNGIADQAGAANQWQKDEHYWKAVANALDRVFFVASCLAVITTIAIIFPR